MKCETCGEQIPKARLEAIPNAVTCVKCSTEQPVGGIMDNASKNDSVLIVVDSPATAKLLTRRGFHAFLGAALQSYNNPRIVKSHQAAEEVRNLSIAVKETEKVTELYDIVNNNKARCHPQRPRINSKGDCAECAIAWYKVKRR